MKEQMLEFLTAHPCCVISTASKDARPEAAFVGYSSNKNLEIIIGTSRNSRKFKNIVENPSVAIVVADFKGTVQYEGEAKEISYEDYQALIEGQHFKKLPGAATYREDPTQVWLKIQPTWARFILHGATNQIEEFTEFA